MADIRIKDLTTTASSTASDDFFAVDGTTNGTRKLNAYSPSFGGNATVTGTLTVNGGFTVGATVQMANTATLASGTRLTLDTQAQQGIDIFRSDSNANFSAIRFRDTTNANTNAQIGWSGTTLRLDGTVVSIPGTTASTSTSTGALVVSGGVGVAGAAYVGGALTTRGSLTIDNETAAPVNSASVPGAFNFTGYGWDTNVGSKQIGIRLDPIFLYSSASGSNSPLGQTYPDLAFKFLNSDAGGTYSEKMRLTGSGNLLIGGTGNIAGSGGIKIFGTTASTSTSSGALIVSGGVGVAGAINCGGDITLATNTKAFYNLNYATAKGVQVGYFARGENNGWTTGLHFYSSNTNYSATLVHQPGSGDLTLYTTSSASDYTASEAALVVTAAKQVQVKATTASSSTTTGALVVSGGVGVAGAVNTGGGFSTVGAMTLPAAWTAAYGLGLSSDSNVSKVWYGDGTGKELQFISRTGSTNTVRMTLTDTGALTVTGNVGITATTASTSTSTGALTCSGGVGVAKEVYVGKTCKVGTGSDNEGYTNVFTNKAENTAGPFDITLPSDCVGVVFLNSYQGGVGRSFREIPFICFGGTVTLGTSRTTVLTADPVTSVAAAASSKITISLYAANTNCYWGIYVNKS